MEQLQNVCHKIQFYKKNSFAFCIISDNKKWKASFESIDFKGHEEDHDGEFTEQDYLKVLLQVLTCS